MVTYELLFVAESNSSLLESKIKTEKNVAEFNSYNLKFSQLNWVVSLGFFDADNQYQHVCLAIMVSINGAISSTKCKDKKWVQLNWNFKERCVLKKQETIGWHFCQLCILKFTIKGFWICNFIREWLHQNIVELYSGLINRINLFQWPYYIIL